MSGSYLSGRDMSGRKTSWDPQKLTEMLKFENLVRWRFRLGLTDKKSYNSFNFEDGELIFWILLYLYVIKNHVLQCKLSDQDFNDLIFIPPFSGGKKNELKFCPIFSI